MVRAAGRTAAAQRSGSRPTHRRCPFNHHAALPGTVLDRRGSVTEFEREHRGRSPETLSAAPAGLESGNDRDRLAASKLLLTELYEPAAERKREEEAEAARARERVLHRLDEISRRRVLAGLLESGLIRPGGGRPFAGVVMFDLHELAEWAGAWTAVPLTITHVACGGCGTAGVRLVKEGESVDGEAVYCETCQSQ